MLSKCWNNSRSPQLMDSSELSNVRNCFGISKSVALRQTKLQTYKFLGKIFPMPVKRSPVLLPLKDRLGCVNSLYIIQKGKPVPKIQTRELICKIQKLIQN